VGKDPSISACSGDVVVIGAGLVGLATAFELAERGASVRVYDRGEPAGAASWAGAGMLAPYTERIESEALLAFCAASLAQYPEFVRRIYDAGGVDVHLRLDGVIYAAFDAAALDGLREHGAQLARRGVASTVLDRSSALRAEPWLGPAIVGALLKAGEGHVDNRRLGRALVAACRTRGVRVETAASIEVECDARRVRGVRTDAGFVGAGAVVNACGAWASQLRGVPPDCIAPVEPVKGQMLALAVPAGFVHRATWVPGVYLVPRDDGRLLLGATVESAGFDERVTAQGMRELLDAALIAAPGLAGFSITEQWAGLRPGTPDGLPFVGPTPLDGFWLATGHYRNGILLAPATARSIADAIESGDAAPLLPFAIARLGTEEAAPARMSHA
jgi:glycine oxidase